MKGRELLDALQTALRLKDATRHCYTAGGRRESVAEHSWSAALTAYFIKDEFPGVYVDTLAYRYTRKAPKRLKPRDNVIVRLCSIECCFAHPLTADCEANKEFASDIKAWSGICKNLFIWDYTTDFLYYVNPFPNLRVLQKNVRFFIDHNVIGMFEQGNGQSYSAEFGELRAYLISKLLWDPYMSEKE